MAIKDHVVIQPYDIDLYVLSTTTKEEDKQSKKIFSKLSKTIGIDEFDLDQKEYISAFSIGYKKGRMIGCIYIHNKEIDASSLDHELIHCLNWINEHFSISVKFGEDESVAYFFEYLKSKTIQLLHRNGIKITNTKYVKEFDNE